MKIDSSNQFINIKIIYNNLGSEISDAFPNLPDITVCGATSYKLYVQKSTFSKKKFCENPSSLTMIIILGLKVSLTEKLPK